MANKIKIHLGPQLLEFMAAKKPIIGICNGFQMLVKLGLLPTPQVTFKQEVTLTHNDSRQFENRWVHLKVNELGACVWTRGIKSIYLPVRHGEGKLVVRDRGKLAEIKRGALDILTYTDAQGVATQDYPDNPNGSEAAIAGLTDPSGLVLGLMPHPEAFRWRINAPGWKSRPEVFSDSARDLIAPGDGDGLAFFYNAVKFVRG